MNKLKIAKNRRYFEKAEGTPFIWIADTAWTMPQRMKWDDVLFYMAKRKSQGFSVLQIVALDPESDVEMRNPAGHKALFNDDLKKVNEKYFEYLDWILDRAEEFGFYVLLLPVWGQLVVGENWMSTKFDKTVNESNAYGYGKYIGERYRDRKNILWCLGGDRQPIHKGVDYKNVWRNMAEGLAKGVLNKDLKYNEKKEEWEKLLITYHACYEAETGECSTMSYWTDDESWISYIMLQSGHGLKPKNYELVKKEYDRAITMPVWDGEPAYEKMPTSWPVVESFHGDWIVRKRAYWSLLAGSFGHTYGHAAVWGTKSERELDEFIVESWIKALDNVGANQIKVLRDFLESRNIMNCTPMQEVLVNQKEEEVELDFHIQATINVDNKEAYVYFPSGGCETLDLKKFGDSKLQLWWFNTKNGTFIDEDNKVSSTPKVFEINSENNYRVELKTPTKGEENDWLCILEKFNQNTKLPVESKVYYEIEKTDGVTKVFEW